MFLVTAGLRNPLPSSNTGFERRNIRDGATKVAYRAKKRIAQSRYRSRTRDLLRAGKFEEAETLMVSVEYTL